uniref:Uncharacterized protein n=1 Tax=Oryza sativa subsp. japonica TaxID=39947 RepID=Q6YT81_ORYSJ|nr:hypothetical protein [Oryza sativa Japonica Group]BAD31387.1 hypothetical protein [Oryza sativa Japonica Group]
MLATASSSSTMFLLRYEAPSSSCYYRLLFAAYIGKLCRLFSATDVEFRHHVVIVAAVISEPTLLLRHPLPNQLLSPLTPPAGKEVIAVLGTQAAATMPSSC